MRPQQALQPYATGKAPRYRDGAFGDILERPESEAPSRDMARETDAEIERADKVGRNCGAPPTAVWPQALRRLAVAARLRYWICQRGEPRWQNKAPKKQLS